MVPMIDNPRQPTTSRPEHQQRLNDGHQQAAAQLRHAPMHVPDQEHCLEERNRRMAGRKGLGAVAHHVRLVLGVGALVVPYEVTVGKCELSTSMNTAAMMVLWLWLYYNTDPIVQFWAASGLQVSRKCGRSSPTNSCKGA